MLRVLRKQMKTVYVWWRLVGFILKNCTILTFFPASVAICIAVKPAVPMIMHSWEIHLEGRFCKTEFWSLRCPKTRHTKTQTSTDSAITWYHGILFHTICTSETVSAITKHSAAPLKWKQVALAQAILPALGTTRCNHHHNADQSCCLWR